MPGQQFLPTQAVRNFATVGFAIALSFSPLMLATAAAQGTAAQLLKEGSSYQSADDTSDRAAEAYRILIQQYPKSTQAEQAQFFLGTYYQKKFFILEYKSRIQDWSSFNQAEDALHTYVAKYPRGSYLADAYQTLALISLRRGYNNNKYRADAISWLSKMDAQRADGKVYIYKVVWSPNSEDIIKRTCEKNSLGFNERALINAVSTFENFTIALTAWCRNNCR